VLLGATGTAGRLTAAAMVRQGLDPVLAGRDEGALRLLAEDLAAGASRPLHLEVAVADTSDEPAVHALVVSPADVLVSCVGPFTDNGGSAVAAAVAAGCGYLDCAWEPTFIRRVFGEFGPMAARAGAVLLPAFGYHDVAGSLAATIAVRRTMTGSRPPARVDVGYFVSGGNRGALPRVARIDDSFRWTGGRMRSERAGTSVRAFEVGAGKHADSLSLGSAEHFTIPRQAGTITDVNVYVGWYGRLTKAAAVAGAVSGTASRMPGLGTVWDSVMRGIGGSDPSPMGNSNDQGQRTLAVAETFDADGAFQQRVRVEGPAPLELTASLLSWGAGMLLSGASTQVGALGPAEAFGTEALISGCMALGLAEVHHR
jgi:hypothetical protein